MTTVESKMLSIVTNRQEGQPETTRAIKCAAITQDVAVSFIEWWYKTDGEELENHGDTWDALYQHFITHIYKPTT